MGILSYFRRKSLTASPDVLDALAARRVTTYPLIATPPANPAVREAWETMQSAQYGYIFKTQPAVRKVVSYVSQNVAQLGLHLYRRKDDNDREIVGEHPAAVSVRKPNRKLTHQAFVIKLVSDFMVYDNAYALKFRTTASERLLLPVPAHAVGVVGPSFFEPDAYRIHRADGTWLDVAPNDMIHWAGYDPDDPRMGFSKLETLRQELAGDAAQQQAISSLAESGFLGPGHITRPVDAPEWTDDAQKRFLEQFKGREKDPTLKPVLEEGMEFHPASVSPKDAEVLNLRKFTDEQVSSIYGLTHCPPQNEDELKQFYADVLPPLCEALAGTLDLCLLQEEYLEDDLYFEFDLDEKLQGDERLKALVSAAGAPVMTRNEARGKLNLPAKDGGDELVLPLNVLVGGKPSVGVNPIQDANRPDQEGGPGEQQTPLPAQGRSLQLDLERAIRSHFEHQKGRASSATTNGSTRFDTKGQNSALAIKLETACPGRSYKRIAAEINRASQSGPDFSDERAKALAAAIADPDLETLVEIGAPQEALWELAGVKSEDVDRYRAMQLAEGLVNASSSA